MSYEVGDFVEYVFLQYAAYHGAIGQIQKIKPDEKYGFIYEIRWLTSLHPSTEPPIFLDITFVKIELLPLEKLILGIEP
jgi:hypothetical protein